MKNNSTRILTMLLALAPAATGVAVAAPGANNPGLPGQVLQNSADIADNFSQIQGNRADIMDLDNRVSDLEANGGGGSAGGERSFVDVDCNADPDALMVDNDNSIYFPPNTTYNIDGACNGPLYITEDGVRFVGVGASPSIVLPGDTANAANGAVFADGASDVRFENLTIDASAWGTPAAEGSDAAGVYARNAFVRVTNTRIVGALWSINPYRKALVRLEGPVILENFVNAGLSVGDQSLVTTRGPVTISSNVADSSYLAGIEAYRSGVVDLRRGVSMNLTNANPDATSIDTSDQSLVRIRSGGPVNLDGTVFVGRSSSLRIDTGNLAGTVFARENSSLSLRNMTQLEGEIYVESNSSANLNNAQAGALVAGSNASVQAFGGSLKGANLHRGAIAQLSGVNFFGDVVLFSATSLSLFQTEPGFGSLNGNTVYECGLYVVAEVGSGMAATGNQVPGCPMF